MSSRNAWNPRGARRIAPCLLPLLLSWGCRRPAPAPPPAPRLRIAAIAEPGINRDAEGRPLSVVVRIYQLRDKGAFSRLTFEEAAGARPEEEVLGRDCLGRTEKVLVPGTIQSGTEDLAPGTAYLGIVGLFRKPDPRFWRVLVDVGSLAPRVKGVLNPGPSLTFKVQECFLTLLEARPEPLPGQTEGAAPLCEPRPEAARPVPPGIPPRGRP